MSTTAADLFDRHAVAVYRFFRRQTARPDLAEDLTQEVFLRVVRGLRRYEAKDREIAWLLSIARHVLAESREAEDGATVGLADVEEPSSGSPHVAALTFYDALGLLHPGDRAVYLLKEQGGLSYGEIAAACEMTEEAVRSRLYRARRSIKRVLSDRLVSDRPETS
jgi:RNA polymerase sigma-70 factor (ECF subfamily)